MCGFDDFFRPKSDPHDFTWLNQRLKRMETGGFFRLLLEWCNSSPARRDSWLSGFNSFKWCLMRIDNGGFLCRLPVLLCSSLIRRNSSLTALLTLLKKDGFIWCKLYVWTCNHTEKKICSAVSKCYRGCKNLTNINNLPQERWFSRQNMWLSIE